MSKFLVGVVIGVCLPFAAGYVYVTKGWIPVATKASPLPGERWVARTALRAAIGTGEDTPSPLPADEANLLAGAKVYEAQCAVCHGELGHPASAIAKGMFPAPPQLLPPKKGVTDDQAGETYWKAKNGIRLTGMPGFSESLSDRELWQVSLLLLHADKLPASAQQVLRGN